MKTILRRLQSHAMYEKASFIQDYAVKVQMVLDKDRSAKRYKVRDIRSLQSLIEKKSDNLDNLYIKWIIIKYSQNKMQMVEDILSKAIPALERYQDLKKRNQLQPAHKNLQRIKDIHELLDIMDGYQDTQSRSEQKDSVEQGFYDRGEAELVHDDSKIKIVIPKTEKASCYFGMGTKWCTTGDRNNAFNSYTRDGYDLYYIFFKGVTSKKHYKWAVARKNTDIDIRVYDAQDTHPPRTMIFKARKMYPILRRLFKSTVQFDTNISDADKIAAIRKGPLNIQYIENPSPAMLLLAVTLDGHALKFMKKFVKSYPELESEAVAQNPSVMRYIKNPSEKLIWEGLGYSPYLIRYAKKQTEKMQMFAVSFIGKWIRKSKVKPLIMRDLINPSTKVQLAAIDRDWKAIKDIENPAPETQLAAVQKSIHAFKYIDRPTADVLRYMESKQRRRDDA